MSNLTIPTTDITIDMSTVNGIALSFSGGSDSTLLAYILAKYKYEIDNDFPLRFVNWQVKNFDEYLTPRVEKIIELELSNETKSQFSKSVVAVEELLEKCKKLLV